MASVARSAVGVRLLSSHAPPAPSSLVPSTSWVCRLPSWRRGASTQMVLFTPISRPRRATATRRAVARRSARSHEHPRVRKASLERLPTAPATEGVQPLDRGHRPVHVADGKPAIPLSLTSATEPLRKPKTVVPHASRNNESTPGTSSRPCNLDRYRVRPARERQVRRMAESPLMSSTDSRMRRTKCSSRCETTRSVPPFRACGIQSSYLSGTSMRVVSILVYRSRILGHLVSGNHAAAPVLGESAWRTAAGVRWPWRSTSQASL